MGTVGVRDVAVRLAAGEDAIEEVIGFGVERVVVDVGGGGQNGGNGSPIGLPGKSAFDQTRLSRSVPSVPARSMLKA